MTRLARQRIDFVTVDAGTYNALRDRWRELALGSRLSKAGHRVAALLPQSVNRKLGYAFSTDKQLAELLNTSTRNVKLGMTGLDRAGLIDRQTRPKRDEKKEVIGRERRIYLTWPDVKVQVHEVKGQGNSEGTNGQCEGPYGVPIFRTDSQGCKKDSSTQPRDALLDTFVADIEFLDAFDRILVEQTGGTSTEDVERITQHAFNAATSATGQMPFNWRSVCLLTSNNVRNWFLQRTKGCTWAGQHERPIPRVHAAPSRPWAAVRQAHTVG
jgi:hypothetical protein